MKTIIAAAAILVIASGSAFASCKSEAAGKKLARCRPQELMTKCESDANKACETDSMSKKLAGAAKASHMKKCVDDATGK